MTDPAVIVAKYIATWEQPDAGIRREALAEIWTEDAVYRNATTEFRGHQGIEAAVTEAYETFSAHGYTFRVARIDAHHDAVRYVWEMLPAGGGQPAAIGTQVVLLAPDGRMARDHQFVDRAPAG